MNEESIYKNLNFNLQKNNIGISATELHGMLTGFIVGGNNKEKTLSLTIEFANDGIPFDIETENLIQNLFEKTLFELENQSFQFQLLLPENVYFDNLVENIANWTNQFLFSFGVSMQSFTNQPQEITEAINDLNQISLLHYDQLEDNEGSSEEIEKMIEEIIEYIRVLIMLLFEEFTFNKNQSYISSILH